MDYNNNGGKNRNGENRREYGKRPRIMARRNTAGHYESSDRREKVYSEKVNIFEDGNSYNTYGEHNSYGERRTSFGHRNDNRRQGYGERRPQAYGERRSSEAGDRRPQQRNAGFVRKGQPNAVKQANRKRQQAPKPAQTESGINRMIRRKQQMDSFTYSDNDLISIPVKEEIRLNRFISNSGVCSRREADNYIQAGVVTVNGKVVTELGTKVNINTDDVRFNGERLKGEEKVYIVMNKPKGFVTTASDPHAEKTVMDLIKGCKARVFPVGRLDKNTTGVLMFTNDGEMAEKLTHPSYNKKKIYQVTLGSKLKKHGRLRVALKPVPDKHALIRPLEAEDALDIVGVTQRRRGELRLNHLRHRERDPGTVRAPRELNKLLVGNRGGKPDVKVAYPTVHQRASLQETPRQSTSVAGTERKATLHQPLI